MSLCIQGMLKLQHILKLFWIYVVIWEVHSQSLDYETHSLECFLYGTLSLLVLA